ncbi:uncharacterized protein TNIN_464121 [Trichonephila inaurata madagascariensis]|uniref:Transposase n=1 Tax=Trichonephila inaurata madagascariensis TaxID=2747483 RepID=A0A8X7CPT9_9ARAC|nr:uncharacterized protein TNIN_464121 [Trichonephila inaurata madagascariensis]
MSTPPDVRIKQRSMIDGYVSIEIHRRMKPVYGDSCMDGKNVRKWAWRAKRCCARKMSVFDEHRPGQPISETCDENKSRVDAMIQENHRIKQRDITLQLGISQEREQHIIALLNYRKVSTRWVPRQLTYPMKEQRKTVSQELLNRYCFELDNFINIGTGDESWIHRYDPENKRKSMEYRHPGSQSVKKFKTTTVKVMLIIFWGASDVLYTEFLTKGLTVNSDRYCATL